MRLDFLLIVGLLALTGCKATHSDSSDTGDTATPHLSCGPEYVQEWNILQLRLPFDAENPAVVWAGGHLFLTSRVASDSEEIPLFRAELDDDGLPTEWVATQPLPYDLLGHMLVGLDHGLLFLGNGVLMERTVWGPLDSSGELGELGDTTPLPTPTATPTIAVSQSNISVLGGEPINIGDSPGFWSAPILEDGLGAWSEADSPGYTPYEDNQSLVATNDWYYLVSVDNGNTSAPHDMHMRARSVDGVPTDWEGLGDTNARCTDAVARGGHIYAAPCKWPGGEYDHTMAATIDEEGIPHWELTAELPGIRIRGTLVAREPWLLLFGGLGGTSHDPVDTIFAARFCEEE